jgi:nicotine oxidoreductase
MDCDAVVVGGGFAGVTAARELANRGLRTVLLEARDRLGGRTWTTDFAGDTVEMGGTWIYWSMPHVWAELTRYGLPVVEDVLTFDAGLFGSPPRRYPPDEAFAKVGGLFGRYATAADRAALPRPHDPLYSPAALEIDRLSMADRLDEMGMPQADREWVTGLLYSMAGSPLEEAGLMPVLRWMALGGWAEMDKTFGGYRIAGGTIALLEAMLSDGRVDVRLSTPVTAVRATDDAVRVTTRTGETVDARFGVMAAPVNVWPTIEFDPPLPHSHLQAGKEGMGKPHYDKVFIHVRGGGIGRVVAELPAPMPLNYFLTERHYGDTQLIVGTNQNPSLDISDKQQVADTIRRYVPEIEEVLDVRGHAWAADEYSRGGNTFHRPGQLRYLADLLRPLGRLAFAGADIATGYFGHIDGAIESGLRAARACPQS